MKIVDLLKVESIDLKAQPKDKAAALEHLITLMESGGNLLDKDEYRACVLRREEEGSDGYRVKALPFRMPRQVL